MIAQSGENPGTSEETQTSLQLSTGMSQYVPRNPLVVINPVGRGIWKCKVCKGTITSEEQAYLSNMVFCRIGIWGKFLPLQNKWIQNK